MKSSFVEASDGNNVVVQGFRGNAEAGIYPYVFVGKMAPDAHTSEDVEIELTPENAQILGEELRKHAEFASTTATLEDK